MVLVIMTVSDDSGSGRTAWACGDGYQPIPSEPPQEAMNSQSSDEVPARLTIDSVLQNWVGDFGWGQFWHFVAVSLAWSIESLHTLVMIFADREPEWRCVPHFNATSGVEHEYLPCSPAASICDLDPSSWEWVGGNSASTVSQFGLACGEHYKVGLVQSSFFVGCLIGAGVFGSLSDSFLGRKGSLLLACLLTAAFGIITAFSPSYYFYFIIRGLAGVSVGGVGLSSFVLATEPLGPSKRGQVGMSAFYFFSLGIVTLPLLAYLSHSWRSLYVVTSVATFLYCLCILPFVSESPRWYLVKGRVEDAMHVLRSLAKRNGKVVPSGVTLVADEDEVVRKQQGLVDDDDDEKDVVMIVKGATGTLLDVFLLPATRWRMAIMIFIWFNCAVVYYGISLNVVNVGFNLYLSVLFNGLVEVPAFAITAMILGRVGRRFLVVISMLLSGMSCLVGTFFPHQTSAHQVARLLCGVVGIFGMAGTYNLIFIYTCELFPTVVRNAALGLATQAGQLGAILAPQVVSLGHLHFCLPFLLLGLSGVLGGLSAIGLPETLDQPLWDTMEALQRAESAALT